MRESLPAKEPPPLPPSSLTGTPLQLAVINDDHVVADQLRYVKSNPLNGSTQMVQFGNSPDSFQSHLIMFSSTPLSHNGSNRLLVQFLMYKTAEPLSGFDCNYPQRLPKQGKAIYRIL